MHDYSIDRHPKEKILFLLALVAILVAPTIDRLARHLIISLDLNGTWALLAAISVFGLFWTVYTVFDRYLWKIRLLRRILLVPDLNGRWACTGQTILKSGNPAEMDWSAVITITQSWSRILIHLKTENSESSSVAASISRVVGVGYCLLYEYQNKPVANQLELNMHSGSAELSFHENGCEASGYYFTDQHRQTVGMMTLTKE
uniref:CD-NTase-associated protein 15 domain-containing protein n=1 Tax=Candidatus Kentrum sp. LFY TaxID=2126342 RepID=A0A450WHJ9_9GAMM|nr:MAG: hypothetical protein BECKLFY1418C_GA0070996_102420 [Candidatus Kentron sp. LFY]